MLTLRVLGMSPVDFQMIFVDCVNLDHTAWYDPEFPLTTALRAAKFGFSFNPFQLTISLNLYKFSMG